LLSSKRYQLTLNIVSRSNLDETYKGIDAMGVAMGTKDGHGTLAYAFYPRIENLAHEQGVDLARLLGDVMAHELGHLLLPFGAHTPDGIMRGEWDQTQLRNSSSGRLSFSTEQIALMRQRLETRD
jgi:hypothetical protein